MDSSTENTYNTALYEYGQTEEEMSPTFNMYTGNWYHWVYTRDNSGGTSYINGVVVGTHSNQFTPTDSWWLNGDLTFNQQDSINQAYDRQYAMTIAKVYNRKLYTDEVIYNYNLDKARHGHS